MASMPYTNGASDSKPPMPNGQEPNSNANWAMHNGRNAQIMYGSNTASPAQGGHQVGGGDEWNQFLPQAGNENYMGHMYGYEQAHPEVKAEGHDGPSNGYYMPGQTLGPDGKRYRLP